jgi:hypothetical protein
MDLICDDKFLSGNVIQKVLNMYCWIAVALTSCSNEPMWVEYLGTWAREKPEEKVERPPLRFWLSQWLVWGMFFHSLTHSRQTHSHPPRGMCESVPYCRLEWMVKYSFNGLIYKGCFYLFKGTVSRDFHGFFIFLSYSWKGFNLLHHIHFLF